MFQRFFCVLSIVSLCLGMAFSQPQGPPAHNRRMEQPQEGRMLKQLNLTEAQQIQVKKLRLEMMKKQTQLRSKIETLRLDSKEAFLADKVDRKAIESNIKAITELQEQQKLNMVDFWFGVNQILTPDQQKKWKEVPLAMERRMRQRGAKGHMMHRPFEDDADSQ